MEAICKVDYDLRVEASTKAVKEKERRKKEADEAARAKRRAEEKGHSRMKRSCEPKDLVPDDEEEKQEVIVPEVGFHDIYGVWFFGKMTAKIRQIAMERFNCELKQMMHVYVDVKPAKVADGVQDISVYGHACCLYKWKAQGYHRGLVVLADDEAGKSIAQIYMQSGTWSWLMNNEDKLRLGAISGEVIYNPVTVLHGSTHIKVRRSVSDCLKALADKSAGVRENAVKELIGVTDPQIIQPLLNVLKNKKESRMCRYFTIDALNLIDKPEFMDEFYSVLTDEDVGSWASYKMARKSDPMVRDMLLFALSSDDRIAKKSAAEGIWCSADTRALLSLCHMLEDGDHDFRRIAINSLSAFWFDPLNCANDKQPAVFLSEETKRSIVASLINAVKDENEDVCGPALRLLSELDKSQALPVLLNVLDEFIQDAVDINYKDKSEWPDLDMFQYYLYFAITNLGDSIFCEPLSRLLDSKSWHVKFDAVATLYELGDDRGLDLLLMGLDQEDWIQKVRAATMLLERGDKSGWDILVKGLSVEDNDNELWWSVQAGIVGTLAQSGDPRVVDLFIDILDGFSTRMADLVINDRMISDELLCGIINNLGILGDPKAIEAIKKWQGYDVVGVSWSENREDTVETVLRTLYRIRT
jgi:HEAT repeat protein